jgi:hypothetical protein
MLQQNKGCSHLCGPVAQLGARFHGMEEVTGSIPVRSTNLYLPSNEPLLKFPTRNSGGEKQPLVLPHRGRLPAKDTLGFSG